MEIYSFGCDAEILPLSSEAERKFSILSSKYVPTAFLPMEEFDIVSDNSPLRKINQQCIEDSRHYVKALWNQSEWALSSIIKLNSIFMRVKAYIPYIMFKLYFF